MLIVELLQFRYKTASNIQKFCPEKGKKPAKISTFPGIREIKWHSWETEIWCVSGRLLDNQGTKQDTLYKS